MHPMTKRQRRQARKRAQKVRIAGTPYSMSASRAAVLVRHNLVSINAAGEVVMDSVHYPEPDPIPGCGFHWKAGISGRGPFGVKVMKGRAALLRAA